MAPLLRCSRPTAAALAALVAALLLAGCKDKAASGSGTPATGAGQAAGCEAALHDGRSWRAGGNGSDRFRVPADPGEYEVCLSFAKIDREYSLPNHVEVWIDPYAGEGGAVLLAKTVVVDSWSGVARLEAAGPFAVEVDTRPSVYWAAVFTDTAAGACPVPG